MLWMILVSSLIIRLISLNQSLWLDEAINILAVKNYSLWRLITVYQAADFHPPGYSILLWFWTQVFGYSEITSRIPSVIFGVATVLLVYFIGVRLGSKKLGLISAFLLAINPLHIYYSQEARPYSFTCMAVVLSVYLLMISLEGKKKLILLAVSNVILLSSDYLAYFILPAEFVFLIMTKSFKYIKIWIICLIPAVLLFLLWMPVFLNQLNIGTQAVIALPSWSQAVGSASFKSLALTYVKFIIGRVSFYNKITYAALFVPVGLVDLVLIAAFYRQIIAREKILVLWLFLPVFFGFLISFFVPVYSYFRLLFTLPAFVLMVSLGLMRIKSKFFLPLFLLLTISEIGFTIYYLSNTQFQREDWRGTIQFLSKNRTRGVLLESDGPFPPFYYYRDNSINVIGGLKKIPARNLTDLATDQQILDLGKRVYLLNYLVDITDPKRLLEEKLKQLGYQQENIYNFNGVGFVYEYSR